MPSKNYWVKLSHTVRMGRSMCLKSNLASLKSDSANLTSLKFDTFQIFGSKISVANFWLWVSGLRNTGGK